jgi:hypothetical protein
LLLHLDPSRLAQETIEMRFCNAGCRELSVADFASIQIREIEGARPVSSSVKSKRFAPAWLAHAEWLVQVLGARISYEL